MEMSLPKRIHQNQGAEAGETTKTIILTVNNLHAVITYATSFKTLQMNKQFCHKRLQQLRRSDRQTANIHTHTHWQIKL